VHPGATGHQTFWAPPTALGETGPWQVELNAEKGNIVAARVAETRSLGHWIVGGMGRPKLGELRTPIASEACERCADGRCPASSRALTRSDADCTAGFPRLRLVTTPRRKPIGDGPVPELRVVVPDRDQLLIPGQTRDKHTRITTAIQIASYPEHFRKVISNHAHRLVLGLAVWPEVTPTSRLMSRTRR